MSSAQRDKQPGPPDTKNRMRKPKAGQPNDEPVDAAKDTNMVGGSIVTPVRTTEGI